MPSGLAELEQLHVDPGCIARWSLEMRLGYEQVEPLGLTMQEQQHVESNNEGG